MSEVTANVTNEDPIILGSGELYAVEFDGSIPEDSAIETEANRAGNIKGGASLEYAMESQTVEDDLGRVKKTVITKETVKMKTGLITWVENWLKVAIETVRFDTTTKPGHKITKIGGLRNRHKKNYLLRFVHTKDNGRKIRVSITGKNTGAVTFGFTNENAQQVDAEITADPIDNEGTLVIFDEEIADVSEPEPQNTADTADDTADGTTE